ncbi:MAG: ABC transporter ATP-binding protein [Anaerolineae bacterium]|nr:ABC transporter ATP-binding protein [Anaerolineae bacterium]
MSTIPMMDFENITFGYQPDDSPVLQSLGLSLRAGKITAVLGPNGAGKTTLLHLALGWLKPWQGIIRLAGKQLSDYSRQELGRWMALIPQSEHIPFEYSVLEYVLLGRAPHLPSLGMPGEQDYAAAFEALESSGIANLYGHSILALSGGERQLVLVSRALAQQPRLLLLDEPTAHLDLCNKSRLMRMVRELRFQGITILMTTHEPEVALAVADDVILMEMGKVLAYGPVEATITAENLSRVYRIPIRIVSLEGHRQVLWI